MTGPFAFHWYESDPHQMSQWGGQEQQVLVDPTTQKLMIGEEDDSNSKQGITDFELFLASSQSAELNNNNNNLAELKPIPLPSFQRYTGHLSINGISGHHFHTIASAPSPPRVESNNNSSETTNHNTIFFPADHVVSSSTMDIKTEGPDQTDFGLELEDLATIICGNIADTTVPGTVLSHHTTSNASNGDSRESWFDAFMGEQLSSGSVNGRQVVSAESLQELVTNTQFNSVPQPMNYGLQVKREPSPFMPLLQSRLQNGPPKGEISYGLVSECPSPSSSTPYLAHSPPGHVVSTSDLVRFNPLHRSRISPDRHHRSYAHTTTPGRKSKAKAKSKSAVATSTVHPYADSGLGKEKPVHRCTICNRGFLNKSNIKVHLRTHTGEKPFKCDTCTKSFRQKAHLIKHAQIHKRVGRKFE